MPGISRVEDDILSSKRQICRVGKEYSAPSLLDSVWLLYGHARVKFYSECPVRSGSMLIQTYNERAYVRSRVLTLFLRAALIDRLSCHSSKLIDASGICNAYFKVRGWEPQHEISFKLFADPCEY